MKLEFQGTRLVKVNGHRPQYLSGYAMIETMEQMAERIAVLEHQVQELTGTIGEYRAMPEKSLRQRMFEACIRASMKLGKPWVTSP